MNGFHATDIEGWENEGGAVPAPVINSAAAMTGTSSQIEWAERIRRLVSADFDRVEASFSSIACKQVGGRRAETQAVLAILADKRSEVMHRTNAGYFIRDWQEIGGQIRQMISHDPRYRAIRQTRAGRHLSSTKGQTEELTAV